MKTTKFFEPELLTFGIITAIFLGVLSKEFITGTAIASFYLLIQYLPYLPWATLLDEGVFIKYVVINILGFFFNPLIYYFLNIFGAPINMLTIIAVSLIIFLSGILFLFKRNGQG
jgi:hypothetical protein